MEDLAESEENDTYGDNAVEGVFDVRQQTGHKKAETH